jgi:hypothetical protein
MRRIFTTLSGVLLALTIFAGNPGFGDRGYRISVMGEYSYNTTWSHHGNLDVQALLPFNPYFEMEAKIQFSTANVYTEVVQLRPKFTLPVGEMFLETDLMYRAVARNRVSDFTAGLGVGYRMDYVSVTLGLFARMMSDWGRSWYANETYVVEPFNVMYRIEAFCRPQNNPWNLSFCVSNVDDYQMERVWQPLFMANAYYDVVDHWRLNFGVQCKPTGMFHLDATFYGATFRTGFTYKF